MDSYGATLGLILVAEHEELRSALGRTVSVIAKRALLPVVAVALPALRSVVDDAFATAMHDVSHRLREVVSR